MFDPAFDNTEKFMASSRLRIDRIYTKTRARCKRKVLAYLAGYEAAYKKAKDKEQFKKHIVRGREWRRLIQFLVFEYLTADEAAFNEINKGIDTTYRENYLYSMYECEKELDADFPNDLFKSEKDISEQASQYGVWLDREKAYAENEKIITEQFTKSVKNTPESDLSEATGFLEVVEDKSVARIERLLRTAFTGAQNVAREFGYTSIAEYLSEYFGGRIPDDILMKEWQAILDDRTRHSHRLVDGEVVRIGGLFSNGLRYPGDPIGAPEEIYNCRCCMRLVLRGGDRVERLRERLKMANFSDEDYEAWKMRKIKS